MSHRRREPLETRLERAREVISAQAASAHAEYARLLAAARLHRTQRASAGTALEVIAVRRLYRLGGHASFGAFARAELGISRATSTRLRQQAPTRRAVARAASAREHAAARALRTWLRARGVRSAQVAVVRSAVGPRLELRLDAAAAERLVDGRPRRGRLARP